MRVIKADDVEPLLACLALCANELFRRDVVSICRTVIPGVAGANCLPHLSTIAIRRSKQNAAAFVRIGFLAVGANGVKVALRKL